MRFEAEDLGGVVEGLRKALGAGIRGLVLFGSGARREAREGSDWDLLVVADELPGGLLERNRFLRSLVPPAWRGRVSFIAKTRAEFEGGFPSYYLDIALDGVILLDRDHYIEERLRRVRDMIQEAGLRRRRTAAGFVWEWDRPPAGAWRIDWTGVYGLAEGRPVPAGPR